MSQDTVERFPIARTRRSRTLQGVCFAVLAFLIMATLSGCSHFHGTPPEYVYLSVNQRYLRDRLAVIANRVAEVKNGERLEVVERNRRFLKVKTPDGKVGWIEEHSVIDQNQFEQFQALAKRHAGDKPVVAAELYDELYMHIAPGRKAQRFYLLPPDAKVELLERASVPREAHGALGLAPKAGEPVRMEDWWLARDDKGRTGWMLAGDLNIQVPLAVSRYSESQNMVAAYVLRTVDDPESGVPGGKVPEYLTVLRPYQQGLPYDFDQIRVFTWNTSRHRYETAYRLRNLAGFFPVTVKLGIPDAAGNPAPEFSFRVAQDTKDLSLDPQTGIEHPAHVETLKFRMEGNLVRQVSPPGTKSATPTRPKAPVHRKGHRGKARR